MSSRLSPTVSVPVLLLLVVCLPITIPSPASSCSKCESLLAKLETLLQTFLKTESSESSDAETNVDCGGQDERPSSGRITYPREGLSQDKKRCEWRILAPPSKVIQIQVELISADIRGKNSVCDKLEFIDIQERNSTLLLVDLCGLNPSSKEITSMGSEVLVRIVSADGVGSEGFQVNYKYIPAQARGKLVSCTGVIVVVGSYGQIRFPAAGLPAQNLHCIWRIVVPLAAQVQVKVLWLSMTRTPASDVKCDGGCCNGESLIIRDGDSQSSRQIAGFCDPSAYFPSTVTSNNTAIVELTSRSGAAFELYYRTLSKERRAMNPVCEGQVIDVSGCDGIIQSPDYGSGSYPENARCRWRINAGPGKKVSVILTEFDLEKDKSCRSDSLTFYNGFEDTESLLAITTSLTVSSAQMIGRYCGSAIPAPFTSQGSAVSVCFDTDDTVEGKGFSLQWQAVDANNVSEETRMTQEKPPLSCNGLLTDLTSNEGVIYSPTSQNELNYPTNTECRWLVTVAIGMRIGLTFERFCLESPTDNECYDAVAIFDGPDDTADSLGIYCGSDLPPYLITTSHTLFVSFLSDKSIVCTGFLARYTAIATPSSTTPMAVPRSVSCGVPDVMPMVNTRIVGGVEAIPNSWPWQASIRYKPRHGVHWCGGCIVAPWWIVTAAHCVYYYGNASNFRVTVGDHNQAVFEGPEVTLNVEKVVINPDYHPDTNDHDLALLKLTTEITFGRATKPVCVCDDEIPDGTLCVVTGWGDTRINGSSGKSDALNQLLVPTIKQDVCNQRGWYNGDLTETMLCAGFADGLKDSCQGDSGGPLVRLIDGQWCLIGITSWGFDCAQPNHPGIYTKVSLFKDWIRRQIGAT